MKKNPAFHIKDLVVFFKEAKNYFMSREILLAMDFSTRFRSLALWDMNANCLLDCAIMDIDYNNQPSGAISVNQEQGGICAVINNILIKNGLEDNSVSVLSLGIGPGSYTGIRTSISFAQGWSLALGIHLLPINSVEALALQAGKLFSNNEFHLVVDAQRNEFYHAVYRKNNDEKNVIPELIQPLEIISKQEINIFIEKKLPVLGPELENILPSVMALYPLASDIAFLAANLLQQKGENAFQSPESITPIYLRPVQFVKTKTTRVLSI